MKNERRLIGHCAVDSGQILLIDPCYLGTWKDGDFNADALDKPNPPPPANNYDEVCRVTCKQKAGAVFNDLAVVTSSGFGDGYYPVYATFEGGRVRSVEIVFFGDEEDDEGE